MLDGLHTLGRAYDQLALHLLAQDYPAFDVVMPAQAAQIRGMMMRTIDPEGWIWVAADQKRSALDCTPEDRLIGELGILNRVEAVFENLGVPLPLRMPPELQWLSLGEAESLGGMVCVRIQAPKYGLLADTYFFTHDVCLCGEWIERWIANAHDASIHVDIPRNTDAAKFMVDLRPALKLVLPAHEREHLREGCGVVLGPLSRLFIGYAKYAEGLQPSDMVSLRSADAGLRISHIESFDLDESICVLAPAAEPLHDQPKPTLSQAHLQLLQGRLEVYQGGLVRGKARLLNFGDQAVLNIECWQ